MLQNLLNTLLNYKKLWYNNAVLSDDDNAIVTLKKAAIMTATVLAMAGTLVMGVWIGSIGWTIFSTVFYILFGIQMAIVIPDADSENDLIGCAAFISMLGHVIGFFGTLFTDANSWYTFGAGFIIALFSLIVFIQILKLEGEL